MGIVDINKKYELKEIIRGYNFVPQVSPTTI